MVFLGTRLKNGLLSRIAERSVAIEQKETFREKILQVHR